MIEVIAATQHDSTSFQRTPLGLSLNRLATDLRLSPQITFSNTTGLPEIYNRRINADSPDDILLFIHDDVWIDDYCIVDRIVDGLNRFHVIGIAGNTRLSSSHVAWAFNGVGGQLQWDHPHLSGKVAHGKTPFGVVSTYGDTPQECRLLDGVLLATRRSTLRKSDVRFDAIFDFHFYDADFCRAATRNGLRLGTWPIAVTHASGGAFGGLAWMKMLRSYQAKWGELVG